jgi:hypothetical protein
MKTSVTIISTNLNKGLINNYNDYYVIDSNFTYDILLEKKKVIFFRVLDNLKTEVIEKLFKFMKDNNISYINMTNNIELSLYSDYLIVYDDKNILIEGSTIEVLKNNKLLKRLGFNLPFIVDLSLLLKDYNLLNDIYLNKEDLVGALWK